MLIWIDCDIIAVKAGYKHLLDLANDLVAQNKHMAISTDEAPTKLRKPSAKSSARRNCDRPSPTIRR